MHGTSQTNTSHSHPHHYHQHQHHHHHHHHRSRRRHSHQLHRSLTGLATSPPLTPTKVTKGRGVSPPPSAPPIFSSSPGFTFGSFDDRVHFGGHGVGHGRVQGQGHEADNEFEDGDFTFPSSSPLQDDSGSVGSPPLLPSNRHSISPVRTTGAICANSGSNRRLSDSDMGSPPGGLICFFWVLSVCLSKVVIVMAMC